MSRRLTVAPPRLSKVTVPQRAHPLTKVVFAEMQRQAIRYDELEWKSGVLKSTFKAWRHQNTPGLVTVEAALGALGWSLLPVPKSLDILPPDLRERVAQIAAEWGDTADTLAALMGEVADLGSRRRYPEVHLEKRAA